MQRTAMETDAAIGTVIVALGWRGLGERLHKFNRNHKLTWISAPVLLCSLVWPKLKICCEIIHIPHCKSELEKVTLSVNKIDQIYWIFHRRVVETRQSQKLILTFYSPVGL